MHAPTIHVTISGWAGLAVAVGFTLPFVIAALAGGYILGGLVLDRLGRTVLGTHIRHAITRIAPAKRFSPSDHDYVRHIMRTLQKDQSK